MFISSLSLQTCGLSVESSVRLSSRHPSFILIACLVTSCLHRSISTSPRLHPMYSFLLASDHPIPPPCSTNHCCSVGHNLLRTHLPSLCGLACSWYCWAPLSSLSLASALQACSCSASVLNSSCHCTWSACLPGLSQESCIMNHSKFARSWNPQ